MSDIERQSFYFLTYPQPSRKKLQPFNQFYKFESLVLVLGRKKKQCIKCSLKLLQYQKIFLIGNMCFLCKFIEGMCTKLISEVYSV